MKRLTSLLVALGIAAAAEAQEITSTHVYQAVGQIATDVELLRETMGRPLSEMPPWIVDHALSRHVLYQAQALRHNANQLGRQLGLPMQDMPPAPIGEVTPADVLEVVRATHALLDLTRKQLGVDYGTDLPPLATEQLPRDVLRELVQASRQLNLMLDDPIHAKSTYDQLESAASRVAGVLSKDGATPLYSPPPPFEHGRTPIDVYRRVLECVGLAQKIGAKKGIEVLQLNLRMEMRRTDIGPSDSYHLVTTLLAELEHLSTVLDTQPAEPPPIERPQYILPSHVHRMAGVLRNELARLDMKL